jgi:serine/threonine protein kinase
MEKDLYLSIKDKFPEINLKKIKLYFRQIGEALKYLHQEKKEIHLDVKPENIGISGKRAVLMDFEFCSKISEMNNLNYLK